MTSPASEAIETITLAGGCFWCLEAVFAEVRGVLEVENGYSNGHTPTIDYERICRGDTGYAEVVRLQFDARMIPLEQVLEIYFAVHDPTSLNRQGGDVGTQYRSGIYCENEAQLQRVQHWLDSVRPLYSRPVVTEVALVDRYQPAEPYHQQFFAKNPTQGYCLAVAAPKVEKFRKTFAQWQK
ncbi:MAG: peptide-methionine (S)-S-oxide reductase MsrA [Brachymonas sp.]|nr:peptide-methionine (S)-S-oxide reductase MsrA [Brachymonas sp.]